MKLWAGLLGIAIIKNKEKNDSCICKPSMKYVYKNIKYTKTYLFAPWSDMQFRINIY